MNEDRTERPLTAAERDARVLSLYEQVLEIEQRLIPTGLHVFGRAPVETACADLLRMVASFDRPEANTRALPALVAGGLTSASAPDSTEITKPAFACASGLMQ